jgi:hypothetical protein
MKNGVWIVKESFSWNLNGEVLASKKTVAKVGSSAEAKALCAGNPLRAFYFHEYDEPEPGLPSPSELLEYAY